MIYNKKMGEIEQKLKLLPENPGCYVMLDEDGKIIYVGKAKNLKRRVKQYFYNNLKTEKVMQMVANIADFYYIITASEVDALSLEANLIKKHKPKYNILLKDDKAYPYIKINLKEEFPSFTVTRRLKKDGAKYFGPFMGGVRVRDVLEILNLAFNVRPCSLAIDLKKPRKECLNYHIKKCPSPCSGRISPEEYRRHVDAAVDFLNGNDETVENLLRDKMLYFAEKEQFELAIYYKQKLEMLSKILLRRITSLNKFLNADAVAYESDGIYGCVNVLVIRGGRMQGSVCFEMNAGLESAEALEDFLIQYYSDNKEIPPEIYVNGSKEEYAVLEDYFSEKSGRKVSVLTPKQGVKRQLVEMAENNAREYLDKFIEKIKVKDDMTVKAAERLQRVLGLKSYPKRMECYDISNVSGVDKVGSMVVFIDGRAEKNQYRRFRIKTVQGANDFESLKEVLRRRLSKLGTDEEEKFPKPDLIVIDGGKGQLSSVAEVFAELNAGCDLISLAKREEEIFLPGSAEPVVLDKRDYALRLLQRIRDEAHRFAITYFRALHSERNLESALSGIEGVGKEKRKLILKKFKSLNAIKNADIKELMQVDGIGEKLARAVYEHFKNDREKDGKEQMEDNYDEI